MVTVFLLPGLERSPIPVAALQLPKVLVRRVLSDKSTRIENPRVPLAKP